MIFSPASRFPADPRAVFVLAFSVFVGVIALAIKAQPGTLREAMPDWGVYAWGALLVLGSAIALIGMWIQSVNGIITEQVGSAMVSVAALFYSILMVIIAGDQALVSAGIVFAWGIACALRYFQLQILIDVAYREKIIMGAEQVLTEQFFGEDDE